MIRHSAKTLISCLQLVNKRIKNFVVRVKMGDVAQLNTEQENLRRIRARLLQWDAKDSPLAPLSPQQIDSVDVFTQKWKESFAFEVSSGDLLETFT